MGVKGKKDNDILYDVFFFDGVPRSSYGNLVHFKSFCFNSIEFRKLKK